MPRGPSAHRDRPLPVATPEGSTTVLALSPRLPSDRRDDADPHPPARAHAHRLKEYLVGRLEGQREAALEEEQHWTRNLPANVTIAERVPPSKRERRFLRWKEAADAIEHDEHFAEYQRETAAEEGAASR